MVAAVSWEIVREAQQTQPDPGNGPPNCLLVPYSARSRVLQWIHTSRFSCHPGMNRTLSLLKQNFWWPSMKADTHTFVSACTDCAQGKSSHRLLVCCILSLFLVAPGPTSPLISSLVYLLHKVTQPYSDVDRFSEVVHIVALPKLPTACETADLLLDNISVLNSYPSFGGHFIRLSVQLLVSPLVSILRPTARRKGLTRIWKWH